MQAKGKKRYIIEIIIVIICLIFYVEKLSHPGEYTSQKDDTQAEQSSQADKDSKADKDTQADKADQPASHHRPSWENLTDPYPYTCGVYKTGSYRGKFGGFSSELYDESRWRKSVALQRK